MLTTFALALLLAAALAASMLAVPALRERVLRRNRGTPNRVGGGRQQQIAERLAGLGAWVHDLGDKRLHWSEGAFRLFGIDPMAGEPAPEAFISSIDAADRQRWCDGLQRAVGEGRELKTEFRFRRPDGRLVWIRAALRPEHERGRVARMSGIVQDVSAMRTMQRRLAASEAKFRNLTLISADWIWETDAGHRLSQLSDSIVAVVGPWYRDLVGRRPWEAPESDFLEPRWERYRALVQSHRPIDGFEFSLVAPDGRVFHLEVSGRPVFDAAGTFTGYRGTGRNVTHEREQRMLLELEGEIATIVHGHATPESAMRAIIAAVCARLGWIGGVWLLRVAAERLEARERAGTPVFVEGLVTLHEGTQTAATPIELRCLDEDSHAWIDPIEAQAELADRLGAAAAGARAALLVPIADSDEGSGSLLAFLSPVGPSGSQFVASLASALSRTLSLYLRRTRAEQQLRHASLHDPLTGLPNRANLLRTLEQRLGVGQALALLYIDLDRYKGINDTIGHAAGDRALAEIAQRLRAAIRPQDLAARIGGDEFVVLLAGAAPRAEIERIARSLLAAIERPLTLAERAWFLSASIGVAMAPEDARDAQLLVRCADSAMYQVKTEGRNDVRFFSGELSAERVEQLELAADLPMAFERGEIELHYQPVMAVGEREIVCIEALLRWQHPVLGLLRPERFLPSAEQSPAIHDIGLWVLRRALDDRLQLGLRQHPDIAVSVNVSARQLVDDDFVLALERMLAERELPARLLRIELTESAFVEHPERTARLIARLRDLGVRVIIDNFGTGYASLSYLRNLPVGGLKIDHTFVRDLQADRGNAAIVQAIMTLAGKLGL
ncbi:MAG TPA: EAL domain-containing protein, partial [Burkholderiaceae bacterium]|nr:EAL domain-containing protein [Burkholderiaceae bacterium]